MNALLKGGTLLFYLVALVSPFVPELAPHSRTLLIVFGIFIVAHLGEYLMVRKRLAEVEGSAGNHFIGVLLFGFMHWAPLLKSTSR